MEENFAIVFRYYHYIYYTLLDSSVHPRPCEIFYEKYLILLVQNRNALQKERFSKTVDIKSQEKHMLHFPD